MTRLVGALNQALHNCGIQAVKRQTQASSAASQRAQILVDELDGHRAGADGSSDALDSAMADIARGEDAGDAGFQQIRIAG